MDLSWAQATIFVTRAGLKVILTFQLLTSLKTQTFVDVRITKIIVHNKPPMVEETQQDNVYLPDTDVSICASSQ